MWNFITKPLLDVDGYSGANYKCALLIHAVTVAVRAVLCVPVLAVCALNKAAVATRGVAVWKRVVHVPLVCVSCITNASLVVLAGVCFYSAIQCMAALPETLAALIPVTLLLLAGGALCVVTVKLFEDLFSRRVEKVKTFVDTDNTFEEVYKDRVECTKEEVDELPFSQLFNLSPEMVLFVDHVEMCPDETALIRVVDDEGYTPLYKRRVLRNKNNERYIRFNGRELYLDENKTKPIIVKKEED